MASCTSDLLERMLAGRLAGALTVLPEKRQQWQIRFLAHDAVQQGVWVEPLGDSQKPLDPVIAQGSAVEVAICHNHTRHAFATQIIRRNKHFWLTETMMFNAVLLRGPVDLYPAERRASTRYQVPDGSQVFAQISSAGSVLPVRVRPWDLSIGGISFMCPRENGVMALKPDDSLELKLVYRGRVVGGRVSVRFSRFITDRVIKTGARFVRDSMDETSRKHLEYFLADAMRLARPNVGLSIH